MLKRSFLFNLLLITVLVIGLLYAFFNSLNYLTNHGKQTKVPSLVGKDMKTALAILKKQGFKIQVDSTYISYKNPLEVLFQQPEIGATVKVGRTIFITVNRKSIPKIAMPNLVNLSFRNAILTMQSYRLVMGDTTYRPDVAAGAVLEQWVNGKKVNPGTPIPYGSKIDLVIGEGLSEEKEVPNLIGTTYADAKATLESLGVTLNVLWDGTISDSFSAIVYQQTPEAINELDFKNTILVGDMIDLRIMQNPSQEIIRKNMPGSTKLLGEDSSQVSVDEMQNSISGTNTDTNIRKRRVPGMNVPSNALKEKDPSENSKQPKKNVTEKSIGSVPKKDASPKKETPKKDAPAVKKSVDNIKNEFE